MISSIFNSLNTLMGHRDQLSMLNSFLYCKNPEESPEYASFLELIQDDKFDLTVKLPERLDPFGGCSVISVILESAQLGNSAARNALPFLVEREGINWCDPNHHPQGITILSRLLEMVLKGQDVETYPQEVVTQFRSIGHELNGERLQERPEQRAFYSLLQHRIERGFDYDTQVGYSPFYVIMSGVLVRDPLALNLLGELAEHPRLDWNTEIRHYRDDIFREREIKIPNYLTLAYVFIDAVNEHTLDLLETFVKKDNINWFQFSKPNTQIRINYDVYEDKYPKREYIKKQPWMALLRAAEKYPKVRACLDWVLIKEKEQFRSVKLNEIFFLDDVNAIFKNRLKWTEQMFKGMLNERRVFLLNLSRPQSFPIKALFEQAVEGLEIVAEMVYLDKYNVEPAWLMSKFFEDIRRQDKNLLWAERFAQISSYNNNAWLRVVEIYDRQITPAKQYKPDVIHLLQPEVKENNLYRKNDLWQVYRAAFNIDSPEGALVRARIIMNLIYGKKVGARLPPGEDDLFLGEMNHKKTEFRIAEELIKTKRSAYQFKKKVEKNDK